MSAESPEVLEETEECVYTMVSISSISRAPMVEVGICDKSVNMMIDIYDDKETYNPFAKKPLLQTSNVTVKPYGAPAFKTLGKFTTAVCCEEKEIMATFYLVPGNNGNLMSKDLAENLSYHDQHHSHQ
jgi:hypothetical protein